MIQYGKCIKDVEFMKKAYLQCLLKLRSFRKSISNEADKREGDYTFLG